MALYEENMFEDLASEEAEGAAEAYDETFDEFEEAAEFDEAEEAEEAEGFEEAEEAEEAELAGFEEGEEFEGAEAVDVFEEGDGFEEGEEDTDAALEAGMAYALAAEDTDEFFRRIGGFLRRAARGVGRVVRRAAPVVGRIARTVAPIARLIPHPAAQGIATAANLLGRLRMEGASEDDALEAMAEHAARNPRALPIVAGLAARALVRRAGPGLPLAARRAAVRNVTRAARTLVRRHGPAAIRALPRVVRSVRRTAAARGTPAAVRPRVALNTARRVAASPRLARRLSRPLPRGRAVARRGAIGRMPLGGMGRMMRPMWGGGRSFVLRGPVRITLSPA